MVRCPGQDQRYWKPEDVFEVECSGCGGKIEFFKDEPKLRCRNCGQTVLNPKIDLGCAEWCQYAEQCIGAASVTNISSLCSKLIEDMKAIFGDDQKRIDHALTVLKYAEQIQAAEGGDPLVVKAAAILHDIAIHEAERKYDSAAGKYQEIEGPPIARQILDKYDLDDEAIEHICRIIANHHSAKDIDTIEFRCLWDADRIANLLEEHGDSGRADLRRITEHTLKTDAGRGIAAELFAETTTQ